MRPAVVERRADSLARTEAAARTAAAVAGRVGRIEEHIAGEQAVAAAAARLDPARTENRGWNSAPEAAHTDQDVAPVETARPSRPE